MYVFVHCTDVAMRRYIVCSEGRSRNGFITGLILFLFFFFSSGIFGADGGAAATAKLMQGEGVSRCVDLCWFWGEGANQI